MTHAQSSLRAAASDQAVVYPQGWCRSLPIGGRAPSSQPTLPPCPSLPIRGSALIYSGAEPFQLSLAPSTDFILCSVMLLTSGKCSFVSWLFLHLRIIDACYCVRVPLFLLLLLLLLVPFLCITTAVRCIYIHTYNDNWYLASMHAFNLIGHYSLNYPQAELAAKITTSGEIIVFIKARSFYCWIQYF